MSTPRVSIITPCYNAERFIESYFKSISSLTFNDFEVLVVDDGSADGSGRKLDEIALINTRFRIVHKRNGGVSSARNVGLEEAKGEWITFIDIDDTVPPNAIEVMLEQLYIDCDIVFAGYQRINNNKPTETMLIDTSKRMSAIELATELFSPSNNIYQGCICSKLFKNCIIQNNNIRFSENIKYNEDRLFTFTYLSFAKQGSYTTKSVYNYIQHGDNAMAAINGPNFWKFETDLDAFVEMNKIAPNFNSADISRLVYKSTIVSYHWNRRLNRKFGKNNRSTNNRLKRKLFSVVPHRIYFQEGVKNRYYHYKAIVHTIINKIRK